MLCHKCDPEFKDKHAITIDIMGKTCADNVSYSVYACDRCGLRFPLVNEETGIHFHRERAASTTEVLLFLIPWIVGLVTLLLALLSGVSYLGYLLFR